MADTTNNRGKKRTYASNALLYAFFTIGAIVLINVISTRFFARADLTEAKMYTISQGSKDLVKALPDYLTAKAFISEDLPPELRTVGRYVRDTLDEYKNASKNGKFRWEAIDPGKDKKLEEEASRCHVEKLQIQVLRSSKFELGNYYLGLCLQYGDQVEAIPQVARPEGLEYQITSLIKKLSQKKRKIAFTTGHGEADLNQGLQALKPDLDKEYETTSVNPSTAEIPADVDALIVAGPKQPIDEKGQKEIDKFLMRGKGAIFLVDGMAMSAPGGQQQQQFGGIKMGQPNDTGLGKVLEAYGFSVGQNFVFDAQAVLGPVDVGGGRQMLKALPVYVGAEVDDEAGKDLTVLAGLRGVAFPFPSSVELVGPLASAKDGKGLPNGAKLWRLAHSSEESWKHTGFFVLSPTQDYQPSGDRGPFGLGYAYQGKLKSAFPPGPEAAMSAPDANGKTAAPKAETDKPVRLVVIGDSDFANDEYVGLAGRHPLLQMYATGAQLLFNAIGWTVEDETLAPLRSKTLTPRPIKFSSDAKASALQWGNVVGVPLAFCIFGLARWRLRRTQRRSQAL